jgi:CubicO group peptidase (beta-lactamase class C family)
MILVERGVIDLLDPVEKYLPGFKEQTYYTAGGTAKVDIPMCIKDLLGMTSGMPYGGAQGHAEIRMQQLWDEVAAGQKKGEETGTVEFANRMGQLPLAFKPGSKWQYGVSADIMGAVIEVASGKRFGDFLREEIFEPLGMKDTAFWLPEEKKHRFAATYRLTEGGMERWTGAHLCILPLYHKEPEFQSGGAGLLSTIDDYAKFAMMLANGGELNGVRILSKRTVRFMTQNQLTEEQKKYMTWDSLRGHGYGNFMRVAENEGMTMSLTPKGEYGWDGWLGTYFCVSPEDKAVLMFFVQRIDHPLHLKHVPVRIIGLGHTVRVDEQLITRLQPDLVLFVLHAFHAAEHKAVPVFKDRKSSVSLFERRILVSGIRG